MYCKMPGLMLERAVMHTRENFNTYLFNILCLTYKSTISRVIVNSLYLFPSIMQAKVVISLLPAFCHVTVATACIEVLYIVSKVNFTLL